MASERDTELQPEMLALLSDTLSSAQTIEQLVYPLLELLELVTDMESTYLTRIDLAAGIQHVIFSRNTKSMQIPEGLSVPWEGTLCKRALEEGRMSTDDVPGHWGDSDAARVLGIRSYASTPVYGEGGAVYGTLCAASTQSKPLSPKGKYLLNIFSTLISRQIERQKLLDHLQEANAALQKASETDALTGLANRRRVLAELNRMFALARRTQQLVLVAFIDLDGFKQINDTHGHEAGDVFLIEAGRRLSAGLRSGDVLGRLGGDEFVIVGLASPATQNEMRPADAAHARLAPLLVGHYELGQCALDYAGASLGVVAVAPDAATPDEALSQADAQMYIDKQARRAAQRKL